MSNDFFFKKKKQNLTALFGIYQKYIYMKVADLFIKNE